MRATIIISIVMIGVVLLISSGTTAQSLNHDIIILDDVTDHHELHPEYDKLLEQINLTDNPWQGVQITHVKITELSHNPESSYTLSKTRWWLGNEFDRKDEMDGLHQFLDSLKSSENTSQSIRSHSSIYRPLVRLLNRLATSGAEERELIIYSNLMENDAVSFYDSSTFSRLRNEPQKVQKLLEKQGVFSPLDGINVYFVFAPTTRNEDQQFTVVASFFSSFLESYGASVHVQSGLSLTP